jgi:tRNA uridine 5-carboxymethylaminomethyl modification enzyme
MNYNYDIIVIGGGHAGVEAAMAGAHMGLHVLLTTIDIHMMANTPCNPHIGGSAKGIVVREIDALGGMMGIAADHHPLQIKMLNTAKGPGVQCLRAQVDKHGYPAYMQSLVLGTKNLEVKECQVKRLLYTDSKVYGVVTDREEEITSKAVIITTGTYMESTIISGEDVHPGGPDGEPSSQGLSKCLQEMGIEVFRLKTGTPPRIKKDTIDFSKGEIQLGQEGELAFSFLTTKFTPLKDQLPCYLIYTKPETLQIIRDNLSKSAVFNGVIKGIGPRYCPSIESKVVRFADKPRHQLFLEPEFEHGDSIYLQGFSTGFPHDIQEKLVHTLPGLEHSTILKWSYQIEYDAVRPLQFDPTLRIKKYEGLYGAGQICGTSGYEEAAGLGLMAGINAALWIKGEEPLILRRDESYIGVMIDDLVTKGTEEPYRLMSSRAEYRLLLRHDNADLRLTPYGHRVGLISDERYASFKKKYQLIDEAISLLSTNNMTDKKETSDLLLSKGFTDLNEGHKGIELLKRPGIGYQDLYPLMPELKNYTFDGASTLALETKVKYEGYIAKEIREAKNDAKLEAIKLPLDVDYQKVDGLALEARQKLNQVKPRTIGQASRISGVNPADISILILSLRKKGEL